MLSIEHEQEVLVTKAWLLDRLHDTDVPEYKETDFWLLKKQKTKNRDIPQSKFSIQKFGGIHSKYLLINLLFTAGSR